jgi:hypothetical protein
VRRDVHILLTDHVAAPRQLRQGMHGGPVGNCQGALPDVRLLERKTKVHSEARQPVPEPVADADPRVLENPQCGRLGGADAGAELELMGDFERKLAGERELGRWEEVVVYKGDPDVGDQALDPKPDGVPDFQAFLERPIALALVPRPYQLRAGAQDVRPSSHCALLEWLSGGMSRS